jgi:hypothetical protein
MSPASSSVIDARAQALLEQLEVEMLAALNSELLSVTSRWCPPVRRLLVRWREMIHLRLASAVPAPPENYQRLAEEAEIALNCLDDLRGGWGQAVNRDRWIADTKAPIQKLIEAVRASPVPEAPQHD